MIVTPYVNPYMVLIRNPAHSGHVHSRANATLFARSCTRICFATDARAKLRLFLNKRERFHWRLSSLINAKLRRDCGMDGASCVNNYFNTHYNEWKSVDEKFQ